MHGLAYSFVAVDHVNPFIGSSSSRWSFFNPVGMPFGMVKGGPVTSGLGGYKGGGHEIGYRYDQQELQGFTFLRDFQIGGILLTPLCNSDKKTIKINKKSERASVNYYSVNLGNDKEISVSMTSSERVGFMNLIYNDACRDRLLLLNYGDMLGESGEIGKSESKGYVEKLKNNKLIVSYEFKPPYSHVPVKFWSYLSISNKFTIITDDGKSLIMKFDDSDIILKQSFSYTGADGAVKNFQTDGGLVNFDKIQQDGIKKWNKQLSKVDIKECTEKKSSRCSIFYTALWRSLLGKSFANDKDGKFILPNKEIRFTKPGAAIFNTDTMWGANWNLIQLWGLIYPEILNDFIESNLRIYKETGKIPDGWLINVPIQGMPYNSSINMISAANNLGVLKNNKHILHRLVVDKELDKDLPKYYSEGYKEFTEYGFVPSEMAVYGAASSTLEFSFHDYCKNTLYTAIKGVKNDKLSKGSEAYLNLYDSESSMFLARNSEGKFMNSDFNSSKYYAEGNAFQYQWYVPHDVANLIRLKGRRKFIDSLIKISQEYDVKQGGNTAGYTSLKYNHGNQTGHFVPWLFHYVNLPSESNRFVSNIIDKFYRDGVASGYGYGQDDDQGQLSAWYVLASLGIFDVAGGCSSEVSFMLIPPQFEKIQILIQNINQILLTKNLKISKKNYLFHTYADGKRIDDKIKIQDLLKTKELHYAN
jgi:predicted alpha-1,2-mannosidase